LKLYEIETTVRILSSISQISAVGSNVERQILCNSPIVIQTSCD